MIKLQRFKQVLSAVVVFAFILSSVSISAFAASGQKKITATYKDSKISLNGRLITMKDAKGIAIKSFSYNSQEYVPIQAIAKSLNMTVSYNTTKSSIVLKTTTPSAIGTGSKAGTPGAIGMRPGNSTPGAIGMRPGNSTSGAIRTGSGNGTPGAIGMGHGNGTPGAIGMGPQGKPPENTNTTTASVKITSTQKQLTVTYKNIKTTLNAKAITFKDAKGNIIEPFIYGGYEYVPLTALAKATGLTAVYDTKTNTYKLTSVKK